nr:hypothetical protein GCM10020092_021240 [Actinoplanes digitatis]
MSYGWWMDKHTRHHNNPNHDDLDPDVAPEVLIWATESAWGRRGLKGFITRHQAGLFFPLLTLLGIDLKVSSVKALIRGDMKRRNLEAGLLITHAVGYLTALFLVLSPLQAIAFLVVHQALFGVYLGMTFAPNHKGMPHPDGTEDYLRKQVLTSRNVNGGWLTDAALGGLNYQIEHHLFPAMPTPNLRKAQPIVKAYCAEIGVSYESTSLVESYRQALRHLHEVGAPSARPPGRSNDPSAGAAPNAVRPRRAAPAVRRATRSRYATAPCYQDLPRSRHAVLQCAGAVRGEPLVLRERRRGVRRHTGEQTRLTTGTSQVVPSARRGGGTGAPW